MENIFWRAINLLRMPCLEHFVIFCGANNINKDSPFDIVLLQLANILKKDPVTLKLLSLAYFLEMNCLSTELSLAKLVIFRLTNALSQLVLFY